MSEKTRGKKKTIQGVVVSDKMDRTVAVEMTRRFIHPTYKKFVTRKKKYLAHDETNECGIGDKVVIVESRPLSRRKHWRVSAIVEKAK